MFKPWRRSLMLDPRLWTESFLLMVRSFFLAEVIDVRNSGYYIGSILGSSISNSSYSCNWWSLNSFTLTDSLLWLTWPEGSSDGESDWKAEGYLGLTFETTWVS